MLDAILQVSFPIVANTMGEYGKITRISNVVYGSLWTYACLDEEHGSAAGQIPAKLLREVFNVLKSG